MDKMQILLKKHSSTILTIISSIGVISTTVLAVKATPKAVKLIEEAKQKKGSNLTKIETIKIAFKPYIPTVLSGISTIACVFSINYLNKRIQTSLVSAYAVLNNSYQEYINKTKEIFGEEGDLAIKQEIADDHVKREKLKLIDENKLFFDYQTMQYFESTFDDVLEAEEKLNEQLAATGYASINDFYSYLGLDELKHVSEMGWHDNGDYREIKFEHQRVQFEDGLECWIIVTEEPLNEYCGY